MGVCFHEFIQMNKKLKDVSSEDSVWKNSRAAAVGECHLVGDYEVHTRSLRRVEITKSSYLSV